MFEIASILDRHIAAVAVVMPIYMALTAGRHTRMLLACARTHLPRITFFTIPLPDPQADLDRVIARSLAKRFRLDYAPLRWEEPTSAELDKWLYRTGACVAGRVWKTPRTLQQLDPKRCVLPGVYGDGAEGFYWRDADFETNRVSYADLLEQLTMPFVPEIVELADHWLQQLPVRSRLAVLDLLHVEHRWGCWAGPQEYGNEGMTVMSPYCHRRILQLMLTLPQDYRWQDRLPGDLIRLRWPELLEVPTNKLPWLRQLIRHPRGTVRSAIASLFPPRRSNPHR